LIKNWKHQKIKNLNIQQTFTFVFNFDFIAKPWKNLSRWFYEFKGKFRKKY